MKSLVRCMKPFAAWFMADQLVAQSGGKETSSLPAEFDVCLPGSRGGGEGLGKASVMAEMSCLSFGAARRPNLWSLSMKSLKL